MPNTEKVYFKGESMYVQIIEMDGNTMLGIVDNYPLNFEVHQYRYGDEVVAVLKRGDGWSCWEPLDEVNPKPSNNPVSKYTPDDVFDTADDPKRKPQ